jgi:hypothetical protein
VILLSIEVIQVGRPAMYSRIWLVVGANCAIRFDTAKLFCGEMESDDIPIVFKSDSIEVDRLTNHNSTPESLNSEVTANSSIL